MRHRQRKWKWAIPLLIALALIIGFELLRNQIPDSVSIVSGQEKNLSFGMPLTGEVENSNIEVFVNNEQKLSSNITIKSEQQGSCSLLCRLFGIVTLKTVKVNVVDNTKVIPAGTAVGIYVKADGILVIGTGVVTDVNGKQSEPAKGILQSGDYILKVDDTILQNKTQLIKLVDESKGTPIQLTIRRDGSKKKIVVTPTKVGEEKYQIGVWVRDDLAGIGMMTYITADNRFGALGHCVSDIDTGGLLALGKGTLYKATLTGITKGLKGTPGQLLGEIEYNERNKIGLIDSNSDVGVYGTIDEIPEELKEQSYISIGMKEEIQLGDAQIISDISGKRTYYDIKITDISYNESTGSKGITLEVVDPDLIDLTGGIVQGMSGSPIIQNGKLIGAVTHVFVQDPTKGYGIFIENMLNQQ